MPSKAQKHYLPANKIGKNYKFHVDQKCLFTYEGERVKGRIKEVYNNQEISLVFYNPNYDEEDYYSIRLFNNYGDKEWLEKK